MDKLNVEFPHRSALLSGFALLFLKTLEGVKEIDKLKLGTFALTVHGCYRVYRRMQRHTQLTVQERPEGIAQTNGKYRQSEQKLKHGVELNRPEFTSAREQLKSEKM